MTARKTTPRRFTAAERATLEPLIVRAAVAAVRQAKAEARWEKVPGDHPRLVQIGAKAEEAQRETCAAGKALARAIKKLRGGK
jgi:hypothetical protein